MAHVDVPQPVVDRSETIGGYIGHNREFFDKDGVETDDQSAPWIVVGNYYGSTVLYHDVEQGTVHVVDLD